MSIIKEFREFAVKGNVVDLAVGVVIGTAFGKIVSSLVSDVIMPPIGVVIGGINFTQFKAVLKPALDDKSPEVALRYGVFLQTIFDFLIIALAIFAVVKVVNRFRRQAEPPPAPPVVPAEVQLLTEIRDLLKERR